MRVLGFGLIAYRDMLWNMAAMFCLCSALCLPAIYIYSEGEGYSMGGSVDVGVEKYSLGNLGYSSMEC